ncbi:MAG: SDR family NAD(P)-dependent oxidoreductase [Alphaproteobacteria bacterium]|nr:SDR family NAD(P)-dependent oxidoreductase [Alphaproteobacteria bacterium]
MPRWTKTLFAFSHDLAASCVAFCVALYLRLGDLALDLPREMLIANLALFVATCGVVFLASGLYRGIWAYASVRDLGAILRAATIATALYMAASFLLTRLESIPRSTPVITWFVLLAFLCGSRLFYRMLREGRLISLWNNAGGGRTPVLLLGAGDEADLFMRALASNPYAAYEVVGVIAENEKRVGRELHSVSIMGTARDLPDIMNRLRARGRAPTRLIMTRPRASLDAVFAENLLEQASALGLSISRLPAMTNLHENILENGGQVKDQPIAIEDLLGRPETVLNREAIEALVKGKRALVTGAGGTIGSELARQIAALGPSHLTLVELGEFNLYTITMEMRERFPDLKFTPLLADIRDQVRIKQVFQQEKPEIVFHAAALKHVPIAEENVRETVLTNVHGTRVVADCAAEAGVSAMVLISTDKAVNPTSVMGATKRAAEIYAQTLELANSPTRYLAVRFGNVLGSTGSVVPRFKEQLGKGGPLTVTHPDMTRYFMTVREAVELVLQASAMAMLPGGERGNILVLDMGKPVKIVDLARQMIRLAGLRPEMDIKIVYTGLRPGEKMHEELYSQQEQLRPSAADGVNLLAPQAQDIGAVNAAVTELVRAAQAGGEEASLRGMISRLVPEFNHDKKSTAA